MDVGANVAVIALVLWCLVGVAMTALRLPGTWLIIAGALLYGWWADWVGVSTWILALLVISAIVAEFLELLASVFTARKAGASTQAAWGGFLGAILGMFFLSFLVPVPFLGAMVGALVGCFGGAMIAELSVRRRVGQGTKVGLFSALGFVIGMVTKMAIAMGMAGALVTSVIWSTD
ncbi:MAG: DUF456 domain-containing protein [Planctomycetes bacterium]|nr:DUF456 domain-containing protein [Planctomycetota bacterium]